MIADDLAAVASSILRRFLDEAHIIRVPFRVFPWDESDGVPGVLWTDDRIPPNLIPRDGERYVTDWARPPFPVVALVSQHAEPGLLLVLSADSAEKLRVLAESLRPLEPNTRSLDVDTWIGRMVVAPDPTWQWSSVCYLIGLDSRSQITVVFVGSFSSCGGFATRPSIATRVYEARDEASPSPEHIDAVRYEHLRQSLAAAVMNGEVPDLAHHAAAMGAGIHAGTVAKFAGSYARSFEGALLSTITSFALMNCPNITLQAISPAERLQQARRKRGQRPLYRYHTLRVHSRPSGGPPSGSGDDLALHWVRGHFKDYREKGLFGRYHHVYWWSPHLAGTASRVVDKSYELPE